MRLPWKREHKLTFHTLWDARTPVQEFRDRMLAVQPGYTAAKREGDYSAAFEIVNNLLSREALALMDKRILPQALSDDPKNRPIVVAPVKLGSNKNLLPIAAAHRIAYHYELEVDREIVQAPTAGRTGKSALARLLNQSEFEGRVQKGRNYIVVDDVYTTGGSLAALISYIESQGGQVVYSTVLANSSNVGKVAQRIKPSELDLNIGKKTLDDIARNYGFGFGGKFKKAVGFDLEALTHREGTFLASVFKCSREFLRAVDTEKELAAVPVPGNAGHSATARRGAAVFEREPT